jgi:hypothetical protein
MKKAGKKANRYERAEQNKRILEYHQEGTGLYRFRNRSSVASLELPKPSRDGKRWVGPNGTWEGDSYFLSMVPKEAVLVEALTAPDNKEQKMPEKLILDQPEQITRSGKVEHSVVREDLPLNETGPSDETEDKEKLFTEDPMAGITIIRD